MKQEMETMRVTNEERDLLEQMRNYNRSYPNGYLNYWISSLRSFTLCSDNPINIKPPLFSLMGIELQLKERK